MGRRDSDDTGNVGWAHLYFGRDLGKELGCIALRDDRQKMSVSEVPVSVLNICRDVRNAADAENVALARDRDLKLPGKHYVDLFPRVLVGRWARVGRPLGVEDLDGGAHRVRQQGAQRLAQNEQSVAGFDRVTIAFMASLGLLRVCEILDAQECIDSGTIYYDAL